MYTRSIYQSGARNVCRGDGASTAHDLHHLPVRVARRDDETGRGFHELEAAEGAALGDELFRVLFWSCVSCHVPCNDAAKGVYAHHNTRMHGSRTAEWG